MQERRCGPLITDRAETLILADAVTVAESMRDLFDIYTIIFLALAVFISAAAQRFGPTHGARAAAHDPFAAREPVTAPRKSLRFPIVPQRPLRRSQRNRLKHLPSAGKA